MVTCLNKLGSDFGHIKFGKFLTEWGLPLLVHEEHESSAASRGIHWSKWHDIEGPWIAVGSSKAEFLMIGTVSADLMEAGFCIGAGPVETACARGKVVGGFVAVGGWKAADQATKLRAQWEMQRCQMKLAMPLVCS